MRRESGLKDKNVMLSVKDTIEERSALDYQEQRNLEDPDFLFRRRNNNYGPFAS